MIRNVKALFHYALETDRLWLTPVTEDDLSTLHTIFADPFVRKYLCDDQILPVEQVQSFIETSQTSFANHGYGLWLMQTKPDRTVIGCVGLWDFFEEPQPQLLYALLPSATKQGYAQEGARRVMQYSFAQLGYQYLTASCDPPNVESQRLASRLGMTFVDRQVIEDKPILFFRIDRSSEEGL